jgi:hypothetical protein
MGNTTTRCPEVTEQADPRREPLTSEGKRYIVRDPMSAVVHLALALASARTLDWYNAWLYALVVLLVKVSSALILSRVNPAVLNARGTRHAMSVRERIFFSVFVPSWLAIPIVAGVDVGDAGWTHRSGLALAGGLAFVLLGRSSKRPCASSTTAVSECAHLARTASFVTPATRAPSWRCRVSRSRWARSGAPCQSS